MTPVETAYQRIEEEKQKQTGILDLGDLPLTSWPDPLFELAHLRVLIMGYRSWDYEKETLLLDYRDQTPKLEAIDPRISWLTELTHLDLSKNQISKIENLEKLNKLQYLYLDTNKITKIENLDSLTQLSELYLSSNQIKKIENVDRFPQLAELILTNNQITKIENIGYLIKLNYLSLAFNQISKIENINSLFHLNYLYLSCNQITKIENLENLKNLVALHLANNQISKIENLDNLIELRSLALHSNQISKIENLKNLTKLEILNLYNNQISKIENINRFTELSELILLDNQITKIENLDNLKESINFDIRNNPIADMSLETLTVIGDDLGKIRSYLKEKPYTKLLLPVKLICIGNSGDGKTTLSRFLVKKPLSKTDQERSTHGLKIWRWEDDSELQALIYDFGGQDYFHAAYPMFFSTQSIYLLLWDARHLTIRWVDTRESYGSEKEVALDPSEHHFCFGPHYWLGNMQYFTQRSRHTTTSQTYLYTIQNRYEQTEPRFFHHEHPIHRQYQIDLSHSFKNLDTSTLDFKKLNLLKDELKEEVQYLRKMGNRQLRVPSSVQAEIKYIISNTGKTSNLYEALKVSCFLQESELLPELKSAYLKILHLAGIVLYFPDAPTEINNQSFNLHSYYWVDPSTVSRKIYAILDDIKQGTIGKKDLENKSDLKVDDPLIGLMLHQEIIFWDPYKEHFVIPQYLAPCGDNSLFHLASIHNAHGFTLRFTDYVPHGLMSRIMCRFGANDNHKSYFKNDIVCSIKRTSDQDNPKTISLRICFDPFKLEIKVMVNFGSHPQDQKVLSYLFRAIIAAYWGDDHISYVEYDDKWKKTRDYKAHTGDSINETIYDSKTENTYWMGSIEEKVPYDVKISLDGNNYVAYDDLRTRPSKDRPMVHTQNDSRVVKVDYQEDQAKDVKGYVERALFNPFVEKPAKQIKTVFISYAHEDAAYRHDMMKYLINLERDHHIKIWHDGEIRPGSNWDAAIKENIEKADIVILLLSQDYINSSYVHNVEMKIAMKNRHKQNTHVIPFLLRNCDYSNWNVFPEGDPEGGPEGGPEGKISTIQVLPKYTYTDLAAQDSTSPEGKDRLRALNLWNHPEDAWLQLTKEIKRICGS